MTGRPVLPRVLAGLTVWLLTALVSAPAASASGETLHDAVAAVRAQYRIAGLAVVVVSRNGPVQTEEQGLSADTALPIGSTSKQFTGLAVQQLIAQGRLAPDQRLDSLLPYAAHSPLAAVTVDQLLGHRSGLAERAGAEWQLWPPATSVQDEARRLLSGSPVTAPGSTFEYSNANYTLLGAVIEAVTGDPYAVAVRRLVTEPLALRHTTADVASPGATGHYPWFGFVVAPTPQPQWPMAVPSAMVTSSANDLGALLRAQLGAPSALPAQVLSAARRPVGRVDDLTQYASGWQVHAFWQLHDGNADYQNPELPTLYEHQGNTLRTFSYLAFSPERDLGVAIVGDTSFGMDEGGQWWLTDRIMHAAVGTKPLTYVADPLIALAPAIIALLPLAQCAVMIWTIRSRRRPATIMALLVTGATALMCLWVVPSRTDLPLFTSSFLAAVPDLALSLWTSLGLAAATVLLLLRNALHRRSRLS